MNSLLEFIMTDPEKIQFKNKLKQFALSLIGQRITAARESIAQAQQAANQEEKSSAGDKYETSRAMGHLQKDMHTRQLTEHAKEQATLHQINVDAIYPAATSGAFIICPGIAFFIAAGLGKQLTEGQTIYFLSPHAPLAKALEHKKTGDSIHFNSMNLPILDIY
jgi:transcription elongation GreA/GreB family factor